MSDPYIGEIRIFAGNFAPAGWAFCSGQLLAIAEQETLFQLIGTTFGGDGQSTFGLPDLQGRVPIHQDANFQWGASGGTETVTLTTQSMPSHTHPMVASSDTGSLPDPSNNVVARTHTANVDMFLEDNPNVAMSPSAVTPAGGSQYHDNVQPYIAMAYIISLYGIFPSQN
jgi:microcystin-dependent protein